MTTLRAVLARASFLRAPVLPALLPLALSCLAPAVAWAASADAEAAEHSVTMSAAMAAAVDLGTAVAQPGELHRTLQLYGKTSLDPQQVSHVKARYPGIIRHIVPALGDSVARGEVIATIEANSSLQSYDIAAPIDGVVIEKHANPGEITSDEPLLTIANYASLWVDFAVFPGDAREVRPGLPVQVSMDGLVAQSVIRYLNPGAGTSPTVTARVPLANPDLQWSPGLLVEGEVAVETVPVALMVDNRALQTLEDHQLVFVKRGNVYEAHALTLGRTDGAFTEVLDGLDPGSEYVVRNSYLLKADLGKAGIAHDD